MTASQPHPSPDDASDRPRSPAHQAILRAATVEFAARGFEGARIEAIAKAAGFNKSLIYRYFGDKESLFKEALRTRFEERSQRSQQRASEGLHVSIYERFQETLQEPDTVRLLLREALSHDGSVDPVHGSMRRQNYRELIQHLREAQKAGEIRKDYDPAFLFLACTALSMFPATFPQLAQMITDKPVDSPAFQKGWKKLLQLFSESLHAGS